MPTALIIDDDLAGLWTVRAVIEATLPGWRVELAITPLEGIDLATAHAQDLELVVVDLFMPHLNGYEVVLRLQSIRPDLRILPLTAAPNREEVGLRFVELGCAPPIFRPIAPDALAARIRAAVEQPVAPLPSSAVHAVAQDLALKLEERARWETAPVRIALYAAAARDRLGLFHLLRAAGYTYIIECASAEALKDTVTTRSGGAPLVAVLDAADVTGCIVELFETTCVPMLVIASVPQHAFTAAAIFGPEYPRKPPSSPGLGIIIATETSTAVSIAGAVQRVLARETCLSHPLREPFPNTRLSERERQQFVLEALGFEKDEIARRLGITPESVNTNRHRIIHKLDLNGTATLHRRALEALHAMAATHQ
jgi:DNA-binding NarL/FixJ family response regulator